MLPCLTGTHPARKQWPPGHEPRERSGRAGGNTGRESARGDIRMNAFLFLPRPALRQGGQAFRPLCGAGVSDGG